MNLRDFLDERERELLSEIDQLHAQLAPKEAELAEVRRAKGALGIPAANPAMNGDEELLRSVTLDRFDEISRYERLTMKELVVKALAEHFRHGATTRELVDFFRDGWGRQIERANLSPQISRLYQEGVIGRLDGLKRWYLVPESRRGRKQYKRVAMRMSCGQLEPIETIVWLREDEVKAGDEPIGEPMADPDPDED